MSSRNYTLVTAILAALNLPALSWPSAWRTPVALQLFGPQALHQEAPFRAVEELNAPTPDSDQTSARGH